MRRFAPRLEPLETRETPAGLVAVSVVSGVLTLGTVPGLDGDEVLTVERQLDGSYLLSPAAGVSLRVNGVDTVLPQSVAGVTAGIAASLGAGNDAVTLEQSSVPGSVSINLGAGNNSLTVLNSAVGGNLSVTAGGGNDTVTLSGVASGVGVGGAFGARLGGGTNQVLTTAPRLSFGSALVAGGSGNDTLTVAANSAFSTLAGGLTFSGGGGTNAVTLGGGTSEVALAGRLDLSGTGANTVTVAGARFDAGALRAVFGDGTNSVVSTAADFSVARNVRYAGGGGEDTLRLQGTTVRVGGNLTATAGEGTATVVTFPTALLRVGGAVTITSGNSPGVSNLSPASQGDAFIGGAVTITAGAGTISADVFANSNLAVGGPVTIARGAGPGTLRAAGNGAFLVGGSVVMRRAGGEGTSQIVAGLGGDAVVAGSVAMSGGATQEIAMGGVVGGGVTFTGAPGAAATMFLRGNGPQPVQVGGPVRLASQTAAGQTAEVTLSRLIAARAVQVLGGAGDETLSIDNCAFQRGFAAELGAGADQFRLEQEAVPGPSTFFGPVVLRGGGGADTFLVGGNDAAALVAFRGPVTADGGGGTDTLAVGSVVTFAAGFPLVSLNIP